MLMMRNDLLLLSDEEVLSSVEAYKKSMKKSFRLKTKILIFPAQLTRETLCGFLQKVTKLKLNKNALRKLVIRIRFYILSVNWVQIYPITTLLNKRCPQNQN